MNRQNRQPCKRPAGWGTDHVGQGRCKVHGGNNPIKHGRYSKITRPRIAELISDFSADPNPLDTEPDLAVVRALAVDYVERYDQFTEALIAWHESFKNETTGPSKPLQVLDVADAYRLFSEATKIVERIEKRKAENAISRKDLERVLLEVARVVKAHVKDDAIMRRIERDWLLVRLA